MKSKILIRIFILLICMFTGHRAQSTERKTSRHHMTYTPYATYRSIFECVHTRQVKLSKQ